MSSASIFSKKILFFVALLLSAVGSAQETFNDLPNSSSRQLSPFPNWTVRADFLAWFASEEVASIWADVITVGNNTSSWSVPSFKFKWDYGLRLGIGHYLEHDEWDTALYWTWYRTEAKHTIPFKLYTRTSPEFDAAFLSGDIPESMSAKWRLLLNMFDWELGRSYCISKSLAVRPFLGLKGGWIYQAIHARYNNLTIDAILTTESGKEHLKNNFWGVGPLGGVNTKWEIRHFGSHTFNVFGDFSMATMWGTWICDDVYQNTASKKSSVITKNSTLGALMFRGFMGIGWVACLHEGRSRFALNLGYEMQLWLDQLRIATFQLQRLHNDLTLQGVTLDCQFDF